MSGFIKATTVYLLYSNINCATSKLLSYFPTIPTFLTHDCAKKGVLFSGLINYMCAFLIPPYLQCCCNQFFEPNSMNYFFYIFYKYKIFMAQCWLLYEGPKHQDVHKNHIGTIYINVHSVNLRIGRILSRNN